MSAIADPLNARRAPCPTATNPRLNATRRWAGATITASVVRAFDLRVVYDKASDRLSISATLTEAVAKMLRDGLEPRLLQKTLRGWDSNPQPRS